MGNPIRINLPGEEIKKILEAPNIEEDAHLVITETGSEFSKKEWQAPGTIDNRKNKNLLPQLTKEDNGKILMAQDGNWIAVDFFELMKENFKITKDDLLMIVQKSDEV